MHARLFNNQRAFGPTHWSQHAQAIGLDVEQFQQCLDSGKHAADIRKDLEEGRKAGVTGTPMFFLGYTDPNDSKVKTVTALRGAQPYSRFKKAIDDLLSSQKK